MNIAMSNIAWNKQEDNGVLMLLKKYKIKGVEIAPTKIWQDPTNVSKLEIKKYRDYWNRNNIDIVAMQALLFGHPELALFKDEQTRRETIAYLSRIMNLGNILGAKVVVFGSPKNRVTRGLDKKIVQKIAHEFFSQIANIAKENDILFCIEPNPKAYETDFINTTNEAIALVRLINHPNFRLHLDSGAMTLNGEDYKQSIQKGLSYLSHFHISEPHLIPIGENGTDHKTIAQKLKEVKYDKWTSIEMRQAFDANSKNIEKTLSFVTSMYQ